MRSTRQLVALAMLFCCIAVAPQPVFGVADTGNGITLHYAEMGKGDPIVFVHGSISDYSYWKDAVETFSTKYRAIAYSRRYNYPNTNPAQPGYSAVVDADDLAAFIQTMHLGKVYIVGHSYGALTALFLASRHPELVRAMVLAEPPAISLLAGTTDYDDIQNKMVAPMRRDFGRGDTEAGVADFIDYVYADPHAWDKMSASSHEQTLRDAHEWDVMMTTGTLFPVITPDQLASIHVPTLLMTGADTYAFLKPVMADLARLLPNSQTLVVPGAGHQMWLQQPDLCTERTEAFFSANAGT